MRVVEERDAEAQLDEIFAEVEHGAEVVVQRNGVPIAKIVPVPRRVAGALKGQLHIADDFKDIPPEFDEYVR